MNREKWDKLTDDEKWQAYEELWNEEPEEVFTPHSFLKWELEAASERAKRAREDAYEATRKFWEEYEREHPRNITK